MKFLKVFLAALLAVIVGSLLSGLLWLIVVFGIAGSIGTPATIVMPNSILKIDFNNNITDSPSSNPFAGINITSMQSTGSNSLLQVLRAIEAAAADDRIKGIYMNFSGMGYCSGAAIEEIRGAVEQFKQSGKFVVAYNDTYSQMSYYLASAADKVYIHPEGGMNWAGISMTTLFYKNALDRLGMSAEVFRPTVCRYKSAVEPYILTKMSPANRTQMQMLCDDMWDTIVETVAQARGIDAGKLDGLATSLELSFPEDALRNGLVDGVIYADQMDDIFAEYGVEKGFDGKYQMVSLGDYCSTVGPDMNNLSAPQVGIIYADGNIVDGAEYNGSNTVYGTTTAEIIAQARRDDNIKAVVFRVNSPGGSALASDVIWREMELLKAEKPVIVSMGSYAASGGYYISCPADAIVADRLTLTGSIGVFGLMLEGGKMLNDKLGITYDTVKTNPSADFGQNILGMVNLRKADKVERNTLMRSVDKVYTTFTGKVAAGRNLPLERVLEIAEGRVWSGDRAKEIGLVDEIGGLKAAIAVAADKAGIADSFRITEVLGEQSEFEKIMQIFSSSVRSVFFGEEINRIWNEYESFREMSMQQGVQAYCPERMNFM